MSWASWADVSYAISPLKDNPDLAFDGDLMILEAESIVKADLSGHYDLSRMVSERGVSEQLKQLVVFKARELALIAYWGAPTEDAGTQQSIYFAREYQKLLENIKNGFIDIEGYERLAQQKKIAYY